jgi:hypothetical protein
VQLAGHQAGIAGKRSKFMPICARNKNIKLLFLSLCFMILSAPVTMQPQDKAAVKNKTIKIKSTYKTLGFKGKVERIDQGDAYEFLIQIEARFVSSETEPSRYTMDLTKMENIRTCDLKAFQKPEVSPEEMRMLDQPPEPSELFKDSFALANALIKKGDEPLRLPDIKLHMPKSVYSKADYVRLVIGDGNRYWPIAVELKTK